VGGGGGHRPRAGRGWGPPPRCRGRGSFPPPGGEVQAPHRGGGDRARPGEGWCVASCRSRANPAVNPTARRRIRPGDGRYLARDFSLSRRLKETRPGPLMQRFDYMVRIALEPRPPAMELDRPKKPASRRAKTDRPFRLVALGGSSALRALTRGQTATGRRLAALPGGKSGPQHAPENNADSHLDSVSPKSFRRKSDWRLFVT